MKIQVVFEIDIPGETTAAECGAAMSPAINAFRGAVSTHWPTRLARIAPAPVRAIKPLRRDG